ncbi:hypothetical protein RD110_17885 [Rhodoferax koreense]|uniref:HDOD domain-containing protein n=2 Tax=Rhodoferax koreensis TaxID=1842727 RepID=A0A1P8JYL5_9BURK|nr:hypothetical protein RD110_17885 [Rhodoferax koreense]
MAPNGEVAGFEFRVSEEVMRQCAHDTDAQAAQVAAVLVAARLVALDGRIGFARLPAAWLTRAAVPRDESGLVLGVEFDAASPVSAAERQAVVATLLRFREVGAKLAWDAVRQPLDAKPDFLLWKPLPSWPLAELVKAVGARPATLQQYPVIATDLASVEELESALGGGAHLASGQLTPQAVADRTGVLAPEIGRIARLLAQLSSGADTDVIVRAIKGDVSVSVRLLQRMNSASFAQLGGVASIDQAVPLLGRNDLHRWLSLMMMQFAQARTLSPGLQEVALWRARLLELLAVERGEREPGRFFTLGLASMLGAILQIDAPEVASTLSLPPEAAQALVEGAGPWYVYLRTAAQVEDQSADESSAVADGFASAARVYELSAQAWTWASENMARETDAVGVA